MGKKTILVTGTSSGFGKLLVPLLLEGGHTVLAALRGGQQRLEKTFPEELRLHSGRLFALDLHMERPETFQEAVRLVAERFGGKLDVLVNNAGFGLLGPFEEQSEEQIREQLEVNLFGPMLLTRALLPALRAARGRILNVSSVVGYVTFPFYGTYSATKHALEAHTEGLYYELKPLGVQVGLIEPGGFKTEFTGHSARIAQGASNPDSPYFERAQAFKKWLASIKPLAGDPRLVARRIARLCARRRVPVRTIVGLDAWIMELARRFVPHRWRVAIEDWVFRKIFKV